MIFVENMHTYRKMSAEFKSGIIILIKALQITKTDPWMTSLSPNLGQNGSKLRSIYSRNCIQ